jgi:hypothetical protein
MNLMKVVAEKLRLIIHRMMITAKLQFSDTNFLSVQAVT